MKRLVVVGYPLNHSLSPVMHNAALAELGLDDKYNYEAMPLPSDALPGLVESISRHEIEGANITLPYKTKITRYLSTISSEGLAVGAVNTLHRENDLVIGSNTDVRGFIEAIREKGVNPRGLSATILGAGGVAKSVAYALAEAGAIELGIFNRTIDAARRLALEIGRNRPVEVRADKTPAKEDLEDSDILINCTPVGMAGYSIDESPLEQSNLSSGLVVMDLVYNPLNTRLLRDAQDAGCKTIDGVGMLVHQGALGFELWTGKPAPIAVMRDAVLQALGVEDG
ncbi:MAG: shikimate dehydrogenase [Candidatus Thorarchaeota archaeon]